MNPGTYIFRSKEDDDALIARASRLKPVLISSAQARELFGISEDTLGRLEAEGRIKHFDILDVTKMKRWRYADVEGLWKVNQYSK